MIKSLRPSPLAILGLCAALLILTLLTGAVLITRQKTLTRGIPSDLPGPVTGGASLFCINSALDQYTETELDWALDLISSGGFDRIRLTFPWAEIEPTPGTFDWAKWDHVVERATDQGIVLIAVLDTAPEWAGRPPAAEDLAQFASVFAHRYGDRIQYYQIWHNPNLTDGWGKPPNPAAYVDRLRQAAEAIRAADPDGRILLASLAPTVEQGPENLSEILFLEGLYAAGGAPYFDILTVQAYGFDTGPDDRQVSEQVLNFSRPILLRESMVAHGDGEKAIWASHWGWNSLPEEWEDVPSIWGQVDPDTQAAYTAAAIERVRREWPWMGTMCWAHLQPNPNAPDLSSGTPNTERHWGFAAVGPDAVPRPVFDTLAELSQAQPTNIPGAYTPLSGLAEWEGNWKFSDLGADVSQEGGERVTIPFWGTDFGLRVQRGDYRAYFYITVDGQPAPALPKDEQGRAYLVLTSPDYQPQLATLPIASGLPPGPHTVKITTERGWDQWALAGWTVGYWPDGTVYRWSLGGLTVLGLICIAGLIVAGRRLPRQSLTQTITATWGRLSQGVQLLITAATTGLLWISAWITWGTETGTAFRRLGDGTGITATLIALGIFYYSPWFLLTLLSGLILAVLILLRLDLGLALIAALIPFYAYPWTLFTKAFSIAEILTLISLAAWGIQKLVSRKLPPRKPRFRLLSHLHALDWAVLFLVLVALFSPFVAEFKRVAWRELRLVILEPAALYLMLRTTRLDRQAYWRMVDFFILGATAVALIGLVQYGLGVNLITAEGGISRLRSVYGSPNNVGLYLGRVLPLLVAIPLFAHHKRRRIAYGLAALPVGLALLLSFSKGALLLGVPASLLTIGLLAGGRWLWATLAATVSAGLAAIPLLRLPRFASLLDTRGGTTFFRLKLWRATLTMIRDHPWFGVGLDNFLYQYRGRYILPDAWQEPDLSHPHNVLLDHWARLGIFGAAAGIWIQVIFWRMVLPLRRLQDPDRRALALGLMGSMTNMLAHGLVDHSFFLIDLAFAFFLILALALALVSGQMAKEIDPQPA